MFLRISKRIVSSANRKSLIISALFLIAMQYLISISPYGVQAVKSAAPGVTILDMQLNYSPADAHKTLIDLQSAGRAAYVRMLLIDFIFIISYTLFLMISLTLLFRFFFPNIPLYRFAWIVPLVGGKFDVLENCCFLIQLGALPEAYTGIATISNIFTISKFATVGLSELVFGIGGIVWLVILLIRSIKNDWKTMVKG